MLLILFGPLLHSAVVLSLLLKLFGALNSVTMHHHDSPCISVSLFFSLLCELLFLHLMNISREPYYVQVFIPGVEVSALKECIV